MDLSTVIGGVRFKNPVTASSGVITRSLYGIRSCIQAGAGAVATKSITFIPESWPLPRPSCFMLDRYGDPGSCANIELGFLTPEDGVRLIKELKPLTKAENVVLIGNISLASDIKFFSQDEITEKTLGLAKQLVEAGSDMIELQRLCSVAIGKELAGNYAQLKDYPFMESLVRVLKARIPVPLIFRPVYNDVFENVAGFDAAGADAYSFSSGMFGTVIDIDRGRPVVPFSRPYHGHGCKTFQNHQVAMLAKKTTTPIVPSGGIATGRDVIESLMCGASNCQVQTVVMRHGFKAITEMLQGVEAFMLRQGYRSLDEIIRLAVPHIDNMAEYNLFVSERQVPKEAMTWKIDKSRCVGCAECADACPYGALEIKDGYPRWSYAACEFCGICASLCQSDAITIKKRSK